MITSPSQQAVIKQEEAAKPTEVNHTVEPTDATPTVVDPLIITSEAQQAAEKQGH